jgi:hypothetical protein
METLAFQPPVMQEAHWLWARKHLQASQLDELGSWLIILNHNLFASF